MSKNSLSSLLFIIGFVLLLLLPFVIESYSALFFPVFILVFLIMVIALHLGGYVNDIKEYHNPEDAKRLYADIMSRAKHDLLILGGECSSDFYLDPDITNEINILDSKKIPSSILFGPNYDIKSVQWLDYARRHPDLIKIRRMKRRFNGEHFKIVDNTLLYIAFPHDSMAPDREGYVEKSQSTAIKKKRLFDELWQSAESFDVEKEICRAKPFEKKYLDEKWMADHDCEWGEHSGFIIRDEKTPEPRPATTEEITSLKRTLGIACV